MKRIDLLAVFNTLEEIESELESLSYDEIWDNPNLSDAITDSKSRLAEALLETENTKRGDSGNQKP